MIKKTLYFGNPAYLSLRTGQMVIKLPEVESNDQLPEVMKKRAETTKPIEDIGVVVLDNRRITITQGLLEALLENNCAVITCDSHSLPVGLMLRSMATPHKTSASVISWKHRSPYANSYGSKPLKPR